MARDRLLRRGGRRTTAALGGRGWEVLELAGACARVVPDFNGCFRLDNLGRNNTPAALHVVVFRQSISTFGVGAHGADLPGLLNVLKEEMPPRGSVVHEVVGPTGDVVVRRQAQVCAVVKRGDRAAIVTAALHRERFILVAVFVADLAHTHARVNAPVLATKVRRARGCAYKPTTHTYTHTHTYTPTYIHTPTYMYIYIYIYIYIYTCSETDREGGPAGVNVIGGRGRVGAALGLNHVVWCASAAGLSKIGLESQHKRAGELACTRRKRVSIKRGSLSFC
jgi:hypothetical protein